MTLSDVRRKSGKTVNDVANETKISIERLIAFEEGRRKPTDKEATLLAKCFNVKISLIREVIEKDEKSLKLLMNSVVMHGNVPSADNYGRETMDAFVLLINDLWPMIDKSVTFYIGRSDEISVEMRIKEWKQQLRNILTEGNRDHCLTRKSFPFTTYGFDNPSTCWVELYDCDETVDGIHTVVLDGMNGTSVTQGAETFIRDLIEIILKSKGWASGSMLKNDEKSEKYLFDTTDMNVRFLQRIYIDKEEKFQEIKIKEGEALFLPSELKLKPFIDDEVYRTYRIMKRARDLPEPSFRGQDDYRCKGDRCGNCPMSTGIPPDEQNGCSYCRGIAKAWLVREWLLEKFSDEEIRSIRTYDQLFKKHNQIADELKDSFCGGNEKNAKLTYYHSYIFGNYGGSDNLVVSESGYTNGRHRTKIAQALDLVVPVHWETKEKMNGELIE
ncbi:helix-turn-helix domain-containing protein [Heliorestis convoluta]|uniref:Putative XRE family transcriptional regulator n=1 Tax=Heliorestis convoluta TaxID=356322 RepID=A0A5Q2N256_9FIRM|nr:helix-turn-helix transcriptional regulator [Heliorestis convoluta]QGG47372.1 putative XRE family transcriptional regulator [Heliorestis convoluta]